MDTESVLDRFFEPLQPVKYEKAIIDYEKLEYIKLLLNSISNIVPHNSYIIDYYKKNFFFISKNSLFLCGYTEEEVLELGYDFYEKILSSEDLEKLMEINAVGFALFYDTNEVDRKDGSISYDLLLHRKDGSTFCVNHKLKPFLYTTDSNVWLSVCCVRQSTNNETGNVKVFFKNSNKRLSYSFTTKEWTSLDTINLSETERYIISETDRGTLEKQQADNLGCTRSNIRYYKSQIIKKTNTTTMREAILFLSSNGII